MVIASLSLQWIPAPGQWCTLFESMCMFVELCIWIPLPARPPWERYSGGTDLVSNLSAEFLIEIAPSPSKINLHYNRYLAPVQAGYRPSQRWELELSRHTILPKSLIIRIMAERLELQFAKFVRKLKQWLLKEKWFSFYLMDSRINTLTLENLPTKAMNSILSFCDDYSYAMLLACSKRLFHLCPIESIENMVIAL